MGTGQVGLVLVSHSRRLADGLAELAAQMAPDVPIVAAGGTDDGGIGTSFDAVLAGVEAADRDGQGVVLLCDLGSAQLTADLVLETLEEDRAERVRLVDAPFVEGAVAAATTAQSGASLSAVAAAALSAWRLPPDEAGPAPDAAAGPPAGPEERRTMTLVNALGLHARPAAELARAVAGLDAAVRLGPPGGPAVDACSVLGVLSLGLVGGAEIEVVAAGPEAGPALTLVARMVGDGFGEL